MKKFYLKLLLSLLLITNSFASASQEKEYFFKVTIIGPAEAGKTATIRSFISNEFPDNYQETVGGDFFLKNIQLDNENVRLQIWDIAGAERFRTLLKSFCKEVSAVIFLYDITNKNTFKSGQEWITTFLEHRKETQKIPLMICGNKLDLEKQRQVTKDDVNDLKEKFKEQFTSVNHIEVSAKENKNITALFNCVASQMLNKTSDNDDKTNALSIATEDDDNSNSLKHFGQKWGKPITITASFFLFAYLVYHFTKMGIYQNPMGKI